MNIKIIYLIGINIVSFLLMGWDKYCSIKKMWRISEKNLIGLSILGGGIGTFFGMIIFRHKTKKLLFQITIPLIVIITIYLFIKVK